MNRNLFVGLGSNQGDRESYLGKAHDLLSEEFELIDEAPVRETEPVGVSTNSKFLNTVLQLRTKTITNPRTLLDRILSLETKCGRDRTNTGPDRTIDIDILYWGSLVVRGNPFIPHPRLHRRSFVLKPLCQLAPEGQHPVFGQTNRELLRKIT